MKKPLHKKRLERLEKELEIAEANSTKSMNQLAHWRKIVLKLREQIKEAKGEKS